MRIFKKPKKMIKVVSKKNKDLISDKIVLAKNFDDRVKGLMFIKKLEGHKGILLDPCNSIHTCFVKFPIDVVFLDQNNRVIDVIRSMNPWRISKVYWKAKKVLELEGGGLPEGIKKGDEVEILCTN